MFPHLGLQSSGSTVPAVSAISYWVCHVKQAKLRDASLPKSWVLHSGSKTAGIFGQVYAVKATVLMDQAGKEEWAIDTFPPFPLPPTLLLALGLFILSFWFVSLSYFKMAPFKKK